MPDSLWRSPRSTLYVMISSVPFQLPFGLRVSRDGGVLDFGIKKAVALEPLTNVALAFFEEVDVDRTFLIDRHELFERALGNFIPVMTSWTRGPSVISISSGMVFAALSYGPRRTEARALR